MIFRQRHVRIHKGSTRAFAVEPCGSNEAGYGLAGDVFDQRTPFAHPLGSGVTIEAEELTFTRREVRRPETRPGCRMK